MDTRRLNLEDLLPILMCPTTCNDLVVKNGKLVDSSETHYYELVDGVPDLRVPPERFVIDVPWYEPWDDLENIRIEYPTPQPEKGLPYTSTGTSPRWF